MFAVVGLAEAKAHLKIEGDDEDEDIALKLAAAIRSVENRVDRTFTPSDAAIPDADVPAANAAVLLLVGHFYRNREAVVVGVPAVDLPMAVEWLLDPIARLSV